MEDNIEYNLENSNIENILQCEHEEEITDDNEESLLWRACPRNLFQQDINNNEDVENPQTETEQIFTHMHTTRDINSINNNVEVADDTETNDILPVSALGVSEEDRSEIEERYKVSTQYVYNKMNNLENIKNLN